MTTKTPAQRQAEYYRRRLANGFRQIVVWIKADKVKVVREFIKSLTEAQP